MSESKIAELRASIDAVLSNSDIWTKEKFEAHCREWDRYYDKTSRPFEGGKRLNIYTCAECRVATFWRDVSIGATPFMTQCKGTPQCTGHAQSSMYRVFESKTMVKEQFQWYRPSYEEYTTLDAFARQHVEAGGLLPREAIHDR